MKSKDVEESDAKKFFDYLLSFLSTVLTLCCMGLIFWAIGKGYAALPGHPVILWCIFVGCVTLLAYLEGLQIAILTLERVNPETFRHRSRAYTNHKLATGRNGLNVQRFLVGRQFFVVFVVFLCAQVTTYKAMKLPWLPKFLFILFIETGFFGVMVVLSFGQLMPQLIASLFPITFMNLPGSWFVINLCLVCETLGITHFSWVLTLTVKKITSIGDKEDIVLTKLPCEEEKGEGLIADHDHTPPVNIRLNPDEMKSGAEAGLQHATDADIWSQATIRWIKDDSFRPNDDRKVSEKSSQGLPMPPEIVRNLIQNGKPVPRYLLPPYHPKHIPPHIVAWEMLRRLKLQEDVNDQGGYDQGGYEEKNMLTA